MNTALHFVVLILLNIKPTVASTATGRIKVTIVRLNSASIKPYCPKRVEQNISKDECAKICAKQLSSCSAIEYASNNCTLWKYVLLEENPTPSKNLYLKDTSNTFKKDSCPDSAAVESVGKLSR